MGEWNKLMHNGAERIKAYCQSLEYADIIASDAFINKTNGIYFCFPHLFSPLFDGVTFPDGFLNELSVCGFLFYRSEIIHDGLTDGDIQPDKHRRSDEDFKALPKPVGRKPFKSSVDYSPQTPLFGIAQRR